VVVFFKFQAVVGWTAFVSPLFGLEVFDGVIWGYGWFALFWIKGQLK
jgi:hypothetical protein